MNLKQLVGAVFLLAGMASLQTGCAGNKVDENDPKSMFEDAEADIASDRYLIALDKLRIVKSKFSYSSYSALAQLRMGDVYFLQESYPEASASYETFVELYPKHEKAGYAQFKAAESYFKDIPSLVARDMKSAQSAVNSYDVYLKKYPTGEFIADATTHRQESFNKLAEKELYIAQFYIRRKKFDAARLRLQKLINQFSGAACLQQARELLLTLPNTTQANP
jgi:outer membrane protein assembly factor BamD